MTAAIVGALALVYGSLYCLLRVSADADARIEQLGPGPGTRRNTDGAPPTVPDSPTDAHAELDVEVLVN